MNDITQEDILNWHGSDRTIEELAEYLALILNNELTVCVAYDEIRSYND